MCLLFMLLGTHCIDATYKGNFILILSKKKMLSISEHRFYFTENRISSLLIVIFFLFSLLLSSIKSLQREMDDSQFIASHAYGFCIIPIIRHH